MTTNPLPEGEFGALLGDPPWAFKSYTDEIGNRDVRRHYPTMTVEEIEALRVADIAAKNAHLFLWTTGPFLEKAFGVIRAWGFRYSGTGFVWVKIKRGLTEQQLRIIRMADHNLHVGQGLTTRKNVEICLLARRGSPRRLAKDVREVILAPVREHSRKPEEARERIERYCAGPYVELFARDRRPGWAAWGNEVDRFTGESPDAREAATQSA